MEAETVTTHGEEQGFVFPKTKSRKRKQPDMDTSDISDPASKRPYFKPLKVVASSVNISHFDD